jgi:ribose transport system permease protein
MLMGFSLGYIDFSIGAIIILAAQSAGHSALAIGYPGLFLGGIAVAIGLTLLNVNIFLRTGIPAWVAGIGLAMIYEAFGATYYNFRMTEGKSVLNLGSEYREVLSFPNNIIVLAIVFVCVYMIFNRSVFGINIRSVGSDPNVARMMGVSAKKTILLSSLVIGALIGIDGGLSESYYGQMNTAMGLGSISSLFQPIAAFMLAQSANKIINPIIGVVISTFLVASVFNILTLFHIPSGTWQEIVLGIVVIICGVLAQRGYKGVIK